MSQAMIEITGLFKTIINKDSLKVFLKVFLKHQDYIKKGISLANEINN